MSENNELVIFGATGDLTFSKLLPALVSLLNKNPDAILQLILVGRSVASFTEYERVALEKGFDFSAYPILKAKTEYVFMETTSRGDYAKLKQALKSSARAFYVATPPALYWVILEHLVGAGLFEKGHAHHQIAFEKPFGEDKAASMILMELMKTVADEHQLFRVDHYLAKPLIQDLSGILQSLQPLFSQFTSPHLKQVRVRALETLGILSRGKFYDTTGAIKDMIQSHLLFTLHEAMQPICDHYQSTFLSSLTLDLTASVVGQYKGYRDEMHIPQHSLTETYARLSMRSSLPFFSSVNFVIETGKKLHQKVTNIQFIWDDDRQLTFHITPFQAIRFSGEGWTKLPEQAQQLIKQLTQRTFEATDAYETIFTHFLQHDQRLFPSNDHILASWSILQPYFDKPLLPVMYDPSTFTEEA